MKLSINLNNGLSSKTNHMLINVCEKISQKDGWFELIKAISIKAKKVQGVDHYYAILKFHCEKINGKKFSIELDFSEKYRGSLEKHMEFWFKETANDEKIDENTTKRMFDYITNEIKPKIHEVVIKESSRIQKELSSVKKILK